MATIDHGSWNAYTPATLPVGAPPNAMFARRDSDGVDWYDYVNPGTNFNSANVVIAAYWRDPANSYIVGPATYDPTQIFPAGCIVHEITDYAGSDPQTDFGFKAFDPATGIFSDPVYPLSERTDPRILEVLQGLAARLEALEKK